MADRYNTIEYNGYSIQIERTPVDQMDGEKYWTFNWGRTGQPLLPVGKKFGGYEVALTEAKKLINSRQN